MKLRYLCLALCAALLLPIMLTGCSNNATGDETTSDATTGKSTKAMTITLYSITDKSTTDDAIAELQDAINKITESDFNTHVLLRFYTEDEYEAAIAQKIIDIEEQLAEEAAAAEAKKEAEKAAREAARQGITTVAETKAPDEESTDDADETVINKYGFNEIIYPEENGTQLDIFLINSLEKFQEYQELGYLTALDEQLTIGSKILKTYIHPNFMNSTKVGGKTYAIPNNHVIGEYEYLLVNRELFDKYYYDIDRINYVSDLTDYFNDVIKNDTGYTPLLGEPTLNVKHIGDNTDALLGAVIPGNVLSDAMAPPYNLLNDRTFLNNIKLVNSLNEVNGISRDGSIDGDTKYAAAIIKGDYSTPELYEDEYYVKVLKYPMATNENTYSGMFAVSKYAKDVARCMDIVKYLTINEDFINLMQYGVEGKHYTVDDITGLIEPIPNTYKMNMHHSGNQFLMKQNSLMDEAMLALSADSWRLAKDQNLDMVISPYLGFILKYKDEDGDLMIGERTVAQIINDVAADSAGLVDNILNFVEYEEDYERQYLVRDGDTGEIYTETEILQRTVTVDNYMNTLSGDFTAKDSVKAALSGDEPNSFVSQYNTWRATVTR